MSRKTTAAKFQSPRQERLELLSFIRAPVSVIVMADDAQAREA